MVETETFRVLEIVKYFVPLVFRSLSGFPSKPFSSNYKLTTLPSGHRVSVFVPVILSVFLEESTPEKQHINVTEDTTLLRRYQDFWRFFGTDSLRYLCHTLLLETTWGTQGFRRFWKWSQTLFHLFINSSYLTPVPRPSLLSSSPHLFLRSLVSRNKFLSPSWWMVDIIDFE